MNISAGCRNKAVSFSNCNHNSSVKRALMLYYVTEDLLTSKP